MDNVASFFAYARERHATYLRRAAGGPAPWTDDPVLQKYKFCNVFRELDRTTAWFRQHVREPLRDDPAVLLATVVFRWFNRISTGEAVFNQLDMFDASPFRRFMRTGQISILREAITKLCPDGPWVTGSYTINTRSAGVGLSKLDGVLWLISMWVRDHSDWPDVAENQLRDSAFTMKEFCLWARGPCLADFMTYEIACDLRHTALLEHAGDIDTWANIGPGARRGLNRIFRPGEPVNRPHDLELDEMVHLLNLSRDEHYWPQLVNQEWMMMGGRYDGAVRMACGQGVREKWPRWELREVEHTLCEFDKYQRVLEGSGRPRGTFSGR